MLKAAPTLLSRNWKDSANNESLNESVNSPNTRTEIKFRATARPWGLFARHVVGEVKSVLVDAHGISRLRQSIEEPTAQITADDGEVRCHGNGG